MTQIYTRVEDLEGGSPPPPPPPPPTLSLLELNFLENPPSNRFQPLGQADSIVSQSSGNFEFNADNHFVTTANNVAIYMQPTNWSALVPAIQSSMQIKVKMTLASGTENNKFVFRDMMNGSGMYCRLHHSTNLLWFYLLVESGVNGNTTNHYYFLSLTLSMIPDLYDVPHEWRFEHRNLNDDPDGYAEAQIYCDDVLLVTQKFNNSNIGAEQQLIGFHQGTGYSNRYGLILGNSGSKLEYVKINVKP
jgi:hypothetical protein